jgi:hypothetical protein
VAGGAVGLGGAGGVDGTGGGATGAIGISAAGGAAGATGSAIGAAGTADAADRGAALPAVATRPGGRRTGREAAMAGASPPEAAVGSARSSRSTKSGRENEAVDHATIAAAAPT